jgi:hypothetical protein
MRAEPLPHQLPPVTEGTTWDEYDAMHFQSDEHGLHCILCGSYIRDGWQSDHVERLHGFKGF